VERRFTGIPESTFSFFRVRLFLMVKSYSFREAQQVDIPQMKFIRDNVTENTLVTIQINLPDYEKAMFEDGKAWVCLKDRTVIGFSCGRLKQKDVWALFIDQRYEGHGIGHQLMQLLEDWMFTNGCSEIVLSTSPGTRAEHLYRRRGWQYMGILPSKEIEFRLKVGGKQRRST
jgi:GNAT superfamily N-acetyltransferase